MLRPCCIALTLWLMAPATIAQPNIAESNVTERPTFDSHANGRHITESSSIESSSIESNSIESNSAKNSTEAKLAIIIDDIGYSAELGERSMALPGAFTYALLPMAPHSPRLARLGVQRGKEIILHTPMSNTRGLPLDPGALLETMTRSEFFHVLEANLSAIPEARGLNNHMGSLLTQRTEPMGWLMEFLQEQHLYFVDSRTSAGSRADETARLYQVPSRRRDIFLDHSRDPDQIAQQIDRAITLAKDQGQALAIGHPYPETLTLLEQVASRLDAAEVTLVSASELLPQTLDLSHTESRCPAPPQTLWHEPQAQRAEVPDASHWWSHVW